MVVWMWKISTSGSGLPEAVLQGSVLDLHRSGRPISVTRDKNQYTVDATIQADRRIKQRDIALKLSISQERVHRIIQTLNCRKFAPGGSRDNWLTPRRNTEKLLLNNFLTDTILKGTISSRILPLETNLGFIFMTRKTKGNSWNIVIQVVRVKRNSRLFLQQKSHAHQLLGCKGHALHGISV